MTGRLLSDNAVRSIRWYHDQGWTRKQGNLEGIARLYRVSYWTIVAIAKRDSRRHVTEKREKAMKIRMAVPR